MWLAFDCPKPQYIRDNVVFIFDLDVALHRAMFKDIEKMFSDDGVLRVTYKIGGRFITSITEVLGISRLENIQIGKVLTLGGEVTVQRDGNATISGQTDKLMDGFQVRLFTYSFDFQEALKCF